MSEAPAEVKVWDFWVRLFHWLLVLLVITLFVTGKVGGNWLEWHKLAGYAVLGLVLFRIVWGLVGSHHARFAHFVRGPDTVLRYMRGLLRGETGRSLGHNPVGALSVLAMLSVVAVQAVTGLFANDDVMLEGPYASMVSKELSDLLTRIHKINANVLIALVTLHLLAIAYYFFVKKENMVRAMVTGKKAFTGNAPSIARPLWLAPLLAILAGLAVFLLVKK